MLEIKQSARQNKGYNSVKFGFFKLYFLKNGRIIN